MTNTKTFTIELTKEQLKLCANALMSSEHGTFDDRWAIVYKMASAVRAVEEEAKEAAEEPAKEEAKPAEINNTSTKLWDSLTDLEKKFLHTITVFGFFYDSYDPKAWNDNTGTWYWVDDFAEKMGITKSAVKGVGSSLVKKGLIMIHKDSDPEEPGLWLTITEKAFPLYPAYILTK